MEKLFDPRELKCGYGKRIILSYSPPLNEGATSISVNENQKKNVIAKYTVHGNMVTVVKFATVAAYAQIIGPISFKIINASFLCKWLHHLIEPNSRLEYPYFNSLGSNNFSICGAGIGGFE